MLVGGERFVLNIGGKWEVWPKCWWEVGGWLQT